MKILLTILIILGKILLLILLLILAILLLLLFVPFGYQLDATVRQKEFSGSGMVSYMFSAIKLKFSAEKKSGGSVRVSRDLILFGSSRNERKQKKESERRKKLAEEKKKRLEELKQNDPEKYNELKQAARERKQKRAENAAKDSGGSMYSQPPAPDTAAAADTENARQETKPEQPQPDHPEQRTVQSNSNEESQQKTAEEQLHRPDSESSNAADPAAPAPDMKTGRTHRKLIPLVTVMSAISNKISAILLFPIRAVSRIFDLYQKGLDIREKLDPYISLLTDRQLHAALSAVLGEIKYLLKKISPKQLSGQIAFSCEDPAHTGQILGVFSLLYPYIGPDLILEPDFEAEQRTLDGDLHVTGSIQLYQIVGSILRLLLNSNIRYAIHYIKTFREEQTNG